MRRLCAEHRLVTLTGPGGSGKTRLSLQLAREAQAGCRDGAFAVQLAPIVDPELVPDAIANALGVMGEAGARSSRRSRTIWPIASCSSCSTTWSR